MSLQDYISNGFGFSENNMKQVVYQLLHAYQFLYNNKIVHSDVSPGNILITKNGRIKLCDFEDSYFYNGELEGNLYSFSIPQKAVTSRFLSPELYFWAKHPIKLCDGIRYDPFKADLFSLGLCILFANRASISRLNEYQGPSELIVIYLQSMRSQLTKVSLEQFFKCEKKLQKKIDEAVETICDKNLIYILKRMMRVDIQERASIKEVIEDYDSIMGRREN